MPIYRLFTLLFFFDDNKFETNEVELPISEKKIQIAFNLFPEPNFEEVNLHRTCNQP